MITGSVRIIDDNPRRRESDSVRLRACGLNVIALDPAEAFTIEGSGSPPDLVLIRLDASMERFHRSVAQFQRSGAFLAPIIEKSFSQEFRKAALALPADGFLNDELQTDEWVAIIGALLRKKRAFGELNEAVSHRQSKSHDPQSTLTAPAWRESMPLREREPALYREILARYEEAVKLVLRNRIYKIDDDVFEPFRQIAKELFHAKATARDAVQLHYQTLRKMAPTADAPGAQAYLEVGRTTIIGLMGDLLTYYRGDDQAEPSDMNLNKTASRI